MKITVTGSLGNISRVLTEKLVMAGHEVKVISSDANKEKEIEKLGAIPLIGSVEDYDFVKKSFEGSNAVYLMIPPGLKAPDIKEYIKATGEIYAKVISETGIKYVVYLSSIGAHLPNGLGPTGANYFVEQKLNTLEKVNVLHLRPGLFMSNFYGVSGMIKQQNMLGNNFEGTVKIPLTHPRDIANVAFDALNNLSISGKQEKYIISDIKNGFEVAKILGDAVDKPNVKWVAFSDEQLLNSLVQSDFSKPMAEVYIVEMGEALRDRDFMKDYNEHRNEAAGGTTLQDFAREFAIVYQFNN